MKRWSMVALLGLVLLISLVSVCRGAKAVIGNNVYYSGKITVATKGADNQNNVFDESVTISEFKIEHWNVMDGMMWWGYDSQAGCKADIAVNDRLGEVSFTFGPKKVFFATGLLSFSIRKDGGKFLYSLQVTPPLVNVGSINVPMIWIASTCDTYGNDYLPLEVNGELTQSPLNNGVPTKITWVLERHIR